LKKEKNTESRYYVNGRWYSPELSIPLCRSIEIFEQTTLYQSPNGAFFTLRESTVDGIEIDGPAIKVMSKTVARSFIDNHPTGIYAKNYTRVFGEPAQG